MLSMMTRSWNSTRVHLATLVVATLALVVSAAHPVQAAALPNCNDEGAATPCFEKVWVDGAELKVTFVDLDPTPANPSDVSFYVLASQGDTPQGGPVPFFHDHVTDDRGPHDHGHRGEQGDLDVHYHGFLVFCSVQGMASGACVPTMTAMPQGTVPLAKTVHGHRLTSSARIESAANSGLLALVDTNSVFVARIDPGQKSRECE